MNSLDLENARLHAGNTGFDAQEWAEVAQKLADRSPIGLPEEYDKIIAILVKKLKQAESRAKSAYADSTALTEIGRYMTRAIEVIDATNEAAACAEKATTEYKIALKDFCDGLRDR